MRLQVHKLADGAAAEVTLSRRNLLALLHKLEMPGSARTLMTDYDCPEGWCLVVRSEAVVVLFCARAVFPGPLHPMSEIFVRLAASDEDGDAGIDSD